MAAHGRIGKAAQRNLVHVLADYKGVDAEMDRQLQVHYTAGQLIADWFRNLRGGEAPFKGNAHTVVFSGYDVPNFPPGGYDFPPDIYRISGTGLQTREVRIPQPTVILEPVENPDIKRLTVMINRLKIATMAEVETTHAQMLQQAAAPEE